MNPDTKKFQVQPNNWTCGPAALRHALLCYGELHSARKLARWAKTDQEGTTEFGLMRAAYKAGYKLHHGLYRTAALAKETVRASLRHGFPIVLCTDKWRHWVCCYHATSKHLWVVDSDPYTPKLVQRLTWREALQRMVKWQAPDETRFDIYTLTRRK